MRNAICFIYVFIFMLLIFYSSHGLSRTFLFSCWCIAYMGWTFCNHLRNRGAWILRNLWGSCVLSYSSCNVQDSRDKSWVRLGLPPTVLWSTRLLLRTRWFSWLCSWSCSCYRRRCCDNQQQGWCNHSLNSRWNATVASQHEDWTSHPSYPMTTPFGFSLSLVAHHLRHRRVTEFT